MYHLRRVWRLRDQHRWLEQRLQDERRRPVPDAFVIQDLKRQKLEVKDELYLAEAGLEPLGRQLARA
jgi:hypothetical protein